ncbi:MAG: ATP-binding cassette domain-containing protein [Alphaproteobacteria bacterium]|nr:ATP-binding cassette domain-containing protein [Alphaproteobacteria bacterium]
MAAIVEIDNLAAAFDANGEPAGSPVFANLDLTIERGEFVTLVGPSGAGKSTLLRIIADLMPARQGNVRKTMQQSAQRRPIAMVFQEARLMPWRRVRDNIAFGLEGLKVDKGERDRRIDDVLRLVGLADYGDRWPYELSGGQRQRVGIARALAVDPDLLLMDEPFGALDAITRQTLQDELLRIWHETGKSVLFVTHDIDEAVYLGDRVLLLGGSPATITQSYDIAAGRPRRRDQEQVTEAVTRVKRGLSQTFEGGAGI